MLRLFFLSYQFFTFLSQPTEASQSKSPHQEEHPLLEALPRQLAEAAEPDELLQDESSNDGVEDQTHEEKTRAHVKTDGYPAGDGQVVDACQVLLQLQQLLEVLHLHHGALELQHHLRNVGQGGCSRKQRGGFLSLVSLRRK